jgi:uncharacterized membrane protein
MAKQWTQLAISLWIMISPWILGFSEISLAKWSNVIFGLFFVIMNVLVIFGEKSGKVESAAASRIKTK